MSTPVIRTFSFHYREKYGHGVGKIPVDMGQVCPNRAYGGCIFCRSASFTPSYLKNTDDLLLQVAAGKKHLLKGRFKRYFAYFQQETCTAVPVEQLLPCLQQLLADPDCVGLILSTRPDYAEEQLIHPLAGVVKKAGKECLLEFGVQSAHERSLQLLNRNHSFADFQDAVQRIKRAGCFELAAHLIFGIPGESEEDMLDSVRMVCQLGVNALKLHHLQVIRDTPLQELHKLGKIDLFSQDAYLELLLKILPIIPAEVTLHRLWATAHPHLLVAPKWNVLATNLSRVLQEKMVEMGIRQGQNCASHPL
ncbi:MAG: TIGR01212 family radical SAM protein [Desulforhopalus sp.]